MTPCDSDAHTPTRLTHGHAHTARPRLTRALALPARRLRSRLVPHPVMLGFVNGLAIVMTRAQLTHFRAPLAAGLLSPQALTMVMLTVGAARLEPSP